MPLDPILRSVLAESRQATADCMGLDFARRAQIRADYLTGMIELARLLALPQAFIDDLDAQRWQLLESASIARHWRH